LLAILNEQVQTETAKAVLAVCKNKEKLFPLRKCEMVQKKQPDATCNRNTNLGNRARALFRYIQMFSNDEHSTQAHHQIAHPTVC